VHPERGFVLHDGERGYDSSFQVGDGLYLTTSRDVLEALARGNGPRHALVALGCAGWGSGQLEQELIDDSWLLVPSRFDVLFQLPLAQRWQAAAGSLGIDLFNHAGHSGHA
jgi:putative transcriptional regulator